VIADHEASTALSPAGVSAVQLKVPAERLVEAQQILADHPVHFGPVPDDSPRLGFWRGSAYGLLIGVIIVLVPRLFGFGVPLPFVVVALGWWFGMIVGLHLKRPNQSLQPTAGRLENYKVEIRK
jgi:hypothetical protein